MNHRVQGPVTLKAGLSGRGLQCFLCYGTLASSGAKASALSSHLRAEDSGFSRTPAELSQIKHKTVFLG